jgi:anti-sigma regulatory factor (Ser/Thr protein kinase)
MFRKKLKTRLGNDKSCVSAVVEMLLAECDEMQVLSQDDHFRVAVALEEALVNAIVHGNLEVSSELRESLDDSYENTIAERQRHPRYGDRKVSICCTITLDWIKVQITDEGPGFDVSTISDPTDPEALERPCGRGMLLMRSFMDDVRYNERGNSVTLVKFASGAACFESSEPAHRSEACLV